MSITTIGNNSVAAMQSDKCDCQKGQLGTSAIGVLGGRGRRQNQLGRANLVEQLDECNYIAIKMYIYRTKLVHIQRTRGG